MNDITALMQAYVEAKAQVDDLKAQVPGLSKAEKALEAAKKAVTDYAKANDGAEAIGYKVEFGAPYYTWDGGKLEGLALLIPQLKECRTEVRRATIKKLQP